jgi:hypothetical protein
MGEVLLFRENCPSKAAFKEADAVSGHGNAERAGGGAGSPSQPYLGKSATTKI